MLCKRLDCAIAPVEHAHLHFIHIYVEKNHRQRVRLGHVSVALQNITLAHEYLFIVILHVGDSNELRRNRGRCGAAPCTGVGYELPLEVGQRCDIGGSRLIGEAGAVGCQWPARVGRWPLQTLASARAREADGALPWFRGNDR